MGEELCFAIRAYTRGYALYAPNEMLATHFYKRDERPKIWRDNVAGRSWTDLEMHSQQVQKRVLLGADEGVYGIGDYQKYLDYQDMIGINFEKLLHRRDWQENKPRTHHHRDYLWWWLQHGRNSKVRLLFKWSALTVSSIWSLWLPMSRRSEKWKRT